LAGIDIATDVEERKKNRRLYKPEDLARQFLDESEQGDAVKRAFQENQQKAKEILFREREVDSLMNMIYGASQELDAGDDDEDDLAIDSRRYDVAPEKLLMFKSGAVKRRLKLKFVTGQSSDQIVKNLLNMSDSEGEADADKRRADKEQLRKIEANDRKVDKRDKRKKRLEARDEKVEDSDDDSEISSDGEGGEEGDGKKKEKKKAEEEKGHAPLKKTDDELKKARFLGEKFGHYKIGTYVRIELNLDKDISRKLEPDFPIVLCSLRQQELSFAFVRVKIKKHRWYPHILKTRDPVTFSIGWRKF